MTLEQQALEYFECARTLRHRNPDKLSARVTLNRLRRIDHPKVKRHALPLIAKFHNRT